MSPSPPEPRRRRARIGLADAPLADYLPDPDPVTAAPAEAVAPARVSRPRTPPAPARAPDPRAEPLRLAAEQTRSVNFHIPRSLDRTLSRLKYELEHEYGVRTSKTALAAAALAALPREPLEALAVLRAFEQAEVPADDAGR